MQARGANDEGLTLVHQHSRSGGLWLRWRLRGDALVVGVGLSVLAAVLDRLLGGRIRDAPGR